MAEKSPQIGKNDDQFLREVKSGVAFRSYKRENPFAVSGVKDFIFETGNVDTVVWGLFIKPFAEPLRLKLYAVPDYEPDGQELFTTNLATGYENEQPNFSKLLENFTLNDPGILIDEDDYAGSGAGASANRIGFNIGQDFARIVPPNTAFMARVENIGPNSTEFFFRLFWSENRIIPV